MISVSINTDDIEAISFQGAFPKTDFETKAHVVDESSGLAVWSVNLDIVYGDSTRSDRIRVDVPFAGNPNDHFALLDPMVLDTLTLSTGTRRDGKPWVRFEGSGLDEDSGFDLPDSDFDESEVSAVVSSHPSPQPAKKPSSPGEKRTIPVPKKN